MKRKPTETEIKEKLIPKYRRSGGFIHCFVDDEKIENEADIQWDHIEPFDKEGKTELDNIAPVCKIHNLAKKEMSLSEYRDQLQIDKFFKQFEKEGKAPRLNDVLELKLGPRKYGFKVKFERSEADKLSIKYYDDESGVNLPYEEVYRLYECPITGCPYFFALVPTANILNDGKEESELELQPRVLERAHLVGLYRHLRVNTQLQPSVCRIAENSILVFDGQHKAAAQIWAGKERIEVKIYLEPDVKVLMATNLVAHDKLRQKGFYSSVIYEKMRQLYGINWDKYIEETTERKSEKGFTRYIKYAGDKPDEKPAKQIEAFLMTSILNASDNRFKEFVAPENKTGKKYPVSWDAMRKYYFSVFLAKPPLEVEFGSKDDFRNAEIENNMDLLNILADVILVGKWYPSSKDSAHKKAERVFRPGAIMIWFPMLADVIFNKLDLVNASDRGILLFRNISAEKWAVIQQHIEKMFNHQIWIDNDPMIDVTIGNKKKEPIKNLFEDRGFSTAWIVGLNQF